MQRKSNRQSRGINSEEKAHMTWVKERCICAACDRHGPVIIHHVMGSAFKKKVNLVTVLLGHWYILGLCKECDDVVTHGSRKAFREKFGPESNLFFIQSTKYHKEIPLEVIQGIAQCGR